MTGAFGELKTDYHFDTQAGVIVSEKHRQLAEIINDYNPELSLMWIPPSQRDAEDRDREFVIVHTRADGSQYPVMWIPLEQMDNPQVVLGRLFAGDMSKGRKDRVKVAIEAAEAADRILREKERLDRMEAKLDFVRFAIDTPLHTFRHNGRKYRK